MQVKKFEAGSVIEALKQVKTELGPDAIILSTQETKRTVAGPKKFMVVAAVSENQLKKKQMAEIQMATVYKDKVQEQSATKQKMFIENVYRGIEKKHEARNKMITKTPYIDIGESEAFAPVAAPVAREAETVSGLARVKEAAQEAFKTSMTSEFFAKQQQEQERLDKHAFQTMVDASKKEATSSAMARMLSRLASSGISKEIIQIMKNQCDRELGTQVERRALIDSWFAKWILQHVKVTSEMTDEQVEVFVGPHGSGKTTALVKLATHYVMQENKSVAIVTTDLMKVGGVEQLRVYSRILNAPVFVVRNPQELEAKMDQLGEYDKVMVDTPGISLSNIEELDFMRVIAQWTPQGGQKVHLVISALTKEGDLGALLKRFRVANFDDVIVTNIDQTSQHGVLLNIQQKMDRPFHSFGIGSDIVDGFEVASRERVLDLIFKLTKKTGERGHDSSI